MAIITVNSTRWTSSNPYHPLYCNPSQKQTPTSFPLFQYNLKTTYYICYKKTTSILYNSIKIKILHQRENILLDKNKYRNKVKLYKMLLISGFNREIKLGF